MRYRLEIKEEARQQLRALAKEHRRNIGWRLDVLQDNLTGDVKKLTARTQEYRLRIGSFRVLFLLERDLISVYAVKDRKKLMSNETLEKPTLESLAAEIRLLRERLEDMEDLMELRAAVERNAGQPGIPWEQAKKELEID